MREEAYIRTPPVLRDELNNLWSAIHINKPAPAVLILSLPVVRYLIHLEIMCTHTASGALDRTMEVSSEFASVTNAAMRRAMQDLE